MNCHWNFVLPYFDFRFQIDKETMRCVSTLTPDEAANINHRDNHGFVDQHPRCIKCGALARPNILMFGDMIWKEEGLQRRQWTAWKCAVEKVLHNDSTAKFVILEIGAGIRVPSVRMNSLNILNAMPEKSTKLIRINVDYPTIEVLKEQCIPLQSAGLIALKKIDDYIQQLIAQKSTKGGEAQTNTEEKKESIEEKEESIEDRNSGRVQNRQRDEEA